MKIALLNQTCHKSVLLCPLPFLIVRAKIFYLIFFLPFFFSRNYRSVDKFPDVFVQPLLSGAVEELPVPVGQPGPELALVDVPGGRLENAAAGGRAELVVPVVSVALRPRVLPLAVREVVEPVAAVSRSKKKNILLSS